MADFTLETPFRQPVSLQTLDFGTGPLSVVMVAGLHGTELTGVHALNLVASALQLARPTRRIRLVPLVNALGLEQGTKRWPLDDRDINHAFPGDPDGGPVARIAHALLQATAEADLCVDVHSGSRVIRELPQVRVPLSGPEVGLARAMELPVVWRRAGDRLEATGLVGAWRSQGKHALHVVGGRGETLDVEHARTIANGLLRLLHHVGALAIPFADPGQGLVDTTRQGVSYHYSGVGGLWVPEVKIGDRVGPGHVLGKITEVVGGATLEQVRANRTGLVVTMRAHPVIHARELLVRVADQVGGG